MCRNHTKHCQLKYLPAANLWCPQSNFHSQKSAIVFSSSLNPSTTKLSSSRNPLPRFPPLQPTVMHFKRGNMKTQASAKCKINILLSFLCFYGHHQKSLCMYGTDESTAAWSVHKCGAAKIQWEFKACLFRGPLCSPPSSLFWVSWEDLEIVISGQSGWLICSGPVSLVITVNPLNHVSTC